MLAKVIHKVTGRHIRNLLQKRELEPLGLRHTEITPLPAIPAPALHAYTADRPYGAKETIYEDSTSWSPSYGLPGSMLMTATMADIIRSAKALGQGTLISKQAQRERIEPITANLPAIPAGVKFDENFYYGLGLLVLNGWQFQNPDINGYASIEAYLPQRKIALAVTVTRGPDAAMTSTNYSNEVFEAVSLYLTPDHPAQVATSG